MSHWASGGNPGAHLTVGELTVKQEIMTCQSVC